jgi:hypothetical protein
MPAKRCRTYPEKSGHEYAKEMPEVGLLRGKIGHHQEYKKKKSRHRCNAPGAVNHQEAVSSFGLMIQ